MGLIRTLLALSVVCAHSPIGFVFVGGENAVQLFFIISGFLITHILTTNQSYKSPIKFYWNRALRIYPIYYVVGIITLILHVISGNQFLENYGKLNFDASVLLTLSNLMLFGQDWVMFMAQNNGSLKFSVDFLKSDPVLYKSLIIPPAWTLGVELSFYAMAPFILRRSKMIFALLFFSITIRIVLIWVGIGSRDPWTYRFFPTELALFLFGALSNIYLLPWYRKITASHQISLPGSKLIGFPEISVMALWLLIVFYFLIPFPETFRAAVLFPVFIFLLPFAFLYQRRSIIDKKLGELSYPIYISHLPIIWYTRYLFRKFDISVDPTTTSLIFVILTIVFSFFLYHYISKPIEKIRSRVRETVPSVPTLSVLQKKAF